MVNVKMCEVVVSETTMGILVSVNSVHVANVMVKTILITYESVMGEREAWFDGTGAIE
jgi:hypothetical protein